MSQLIDFDSHPIISAILVGLVLCAVVVAIYYRLKKTSNDDKAIALAKQQHIESITPSLSISPNVSFQPVRSNGDIHFTITANVTNTGNNVANLVALTVTGQYQYDSGKASQHQFGEHDFLGKSCTLATRSPAIQSGSAISPQITLVFNANLGQRIKYTVTAKAKIGNNQLHTFHSDTRTDYLV